jgi:hypothetical protein
LSLPNGFEISFERGEIRHQASMALDYAAFREI